MLSNEKIDECFNQPGKDGFGKSRYDIARAIEAAVQAEKQEPVAWVGCGECDCEFPCYHGKTTCLRLPTEKQEPDGFPFGEELPDLQEPEKDEPLCYLIEQWMHYEQAAENSPAAFPVFTRPQPDLTAEVERLVSQLTACDVVALSDTPESAKVARNMHPDYKSAACESVARRVDECIELRQRIAELEAVVHAASAVYKSRGGV